MRTTECGGKLYETGKRKHVAVCTQKRFTEHSHCDLTAMEAIQHGVARAAGWKVNPTSVYLTDNGAAYCGEHLGQTAKATGCDLSGQPIEEVTPELARVAAEELGIALTCEHPSCGRVASVLHKAAV